jgi:hypothetical protein
MHKINHRFLRAAMHDFLFASIAGAAIVGLLYQWQANIVVLVLAWLCTGMCAGCCLLAAFALAVVSYGRRTTGEQPDSNPDPV